MYFTTDLAVVCRVHLGALDLSKLKVVMNSLGSLPRPANVLTTSILETSSTLYVRQYRQTRSRLECLFTSRRALNPFSINLLIVCYSGQPLSTKRNDH
ncbi:hypothetical protein KC327_g86 [Hortaea werneckii]|nr:hypothetical protein KC327_g86 [Hortaea werneckii]